MPDRHIYVTKDLDERLKKYAQELEARGIDVRPESRRSKADYSLAKIMDYLLMKEGN